MNQMLLIEKFNVVFDVFSGVVLYLMFDLFLNTPKCRPLLTSLNLCLQVVCVIHSAGIFRI